MVNGKPYTSRGVRTVSGEFIGYGNLSWRQWQGAVVLAYNIQREMNCFQVLKKAFAYKMKMDAMKRQGIRTDFNFVPKWHEVQKKEFEI